MCSEDKLICQFHPDFIFGLHIEFKATHARQIPMVQAIAQAYIQHDEFCISYNLLHVSDFLLASLITSLKSSPSLSSGVFSGFL